MTQEQTHIQHLMLEQLSRVFVDIPFNRMLGLRLEILGTDHVTMRFDMKKELIGNFLHGILHGGVISSVLDMAGGMAVMSAAIHKHPDQTMEKLVEIVGKCSTVDLHISYLNPGRGEHFIAKAALSKSGNKLSFVHMELLNQNGDLIATANGTYLLSKY